MEYRKKPGRLPRPLDPLQTEHQTTRRRHRGRQRRGASLMSVAALNEGHAKVLSSRRPGPLPPPPPPPAAAHPLFKPLRRRHGVVVGPLVRAAGPGLLASVGIPSQLVVIGSASGSAHRAAGDRRHVLRSGYSSFAIIRSSGPSWRCLLHRLSFLASGTNRSVIAGVGHLAGKRSATFF